METAADFIDALGGTVKVAAELDIAASTVSSWKQANSIPRWRLPDLRELATQADIAVPGRFSRTNKRAAA